MSLKQYPPTHHRDVEHLRQELETITHLLTVCIDSMRLTNTLELLSAVEVLQMAADRAWEAIEPAKELETTLYEKWLAECKVQEEQQRADECAQWEANLPPGAVEAFKAVNAAYGIKSGEDAE